MLLKVVVLALLGSVAACPAPTHEQCAIPDAGAFGGGPGGSGGTTDGLEAELVAADGSGNLITLHDGDPVPLMRAPQGGHILLVGARVHSDDTCDLDATGSLRDLATNRVIGLDERTLYVTATGDGWAAPEQPVDLNAMPNVAVCPTSATTAAVEGNPYQLEVAISSNGSQVADLEITAIPTCAPDDTYCMTECGPSAGP
ncbi:MAG: hypothetical protein ABI467_10990 [Kofleriaceae bacterium]